MLNPFFLQGSNSEQNLVQDLINEQLRMYGVEVYYMPRQFVTTNTIIKEVIESEFNNSYPIEAYVDSYEGYGGQGTLLSKFGIQNYDDLKIIISKERYENYIAPLSKNLSNIELTTRPKEGDLIYFPLGDRLFEIKYVEHEQPFYQLQKNYVYTLTCSLFRIEDEVIDTGVDEIDDNTQDHGYIQTLQLIGSATTSIATATLCSSGAVNSISITNMGNNYNTAPVVAFSSAPFGGVTAVGIATITNGYVNCSGESGGKVLSIQITNAGCGYTVPPLVKLTTPKGYTGSGAAATTGISTYTSVQYITVTNGGGGYISTPTVGISTPKHVGAAATAVLDVPSQTGAGVSVISAPISIGSSAHLFPYGTTGGVFYNTAPTVTFSAPTGTGNQALGAATVDDFGLYGGTVQNLAITTEGKFYTSVPTVVIEHPGMSPAVATIGIAGSSIDSGSIAFSTTGRAYTSRPIVTIGTGIGTITPTQVAVGIATIHSITGIITAVSFNISDSWATGTGATIGAGYTVTPTISFSSPSPVRATATVTVSIAGTVNTISIGNSGFGYQTAPSITIDAPSGADEQFRALGIATVRFDSVKTTGTIGIGSDYISGITTTGIIAGDRVRLQYHHETSHTLFPTSNFISTSTYVTSVGYGTVYMSEVSTNVGIATTAFEFGIDKCGIVTGIAVTFGGGGYLSVPTVTISNDPSEKNYVELIAGINTATGVALVSAAGTVTGIQITDTGSNYVILPEVTISDAASNSGSGSFEFNEIVTGSITGTTARVRKWDITTNQLEVSNISGYFSNGEVLVGTASSASFQLRSINENINDDGFADNTDIETEADSILDFSEQNPFGIP